jgi:hypothetical protein
MLAYVLFDISMPIFAEQSSYRKGKGKDIPVRGHGGP